MKEHFARFRSCYIRDLSFTAHLSITRLGVYSLSAGSLHARAKTYSSQPQEPASWSFTSYKY